MAELRLVKSHEHDFQPTKYDKWELRCTDPECYVAKILVGNPRYCNKVLIGEPHLPHEHRYRYKRYHEFSWTTGQYYCDGVPG